MRRHAKAMLVAAALCLFLALGAAPAFGAKTVIATIGGETTGSQGNQLNGPRGVAINQSGAGGVPAGTFYVAESGNQRVQQFGPSGGFVRAWGYGVRDGAAEFQTCTVASQCRAATSNTAAGALATPIGIAVDSAKGNVFVTNQAARRISIYGPTGIFFGAFGWGTVDGTAALQFCTTLSGCGPAGTAAPATGNVGGGQFGSQMGSVAVSPSGEIYVADKTSRRVQVFKQTFSGNVVTGVEFQRAYGWGAATGAAAFEVCTVSPCKAPAAAGTDLGQFATNSPTEVALDPSGNLYALDAGNKRVQVFNATAEPQTSGFGAAALTTAFGTGTLANLAIAPVSGQVSVSGQRSASDNRVAVLTMTGGGDAIELAGDELQPTAATGLAVAQASIGGTVYLTSVTGGHRVYILNDTTPTLEGISAITAHGATVAGSVVSNELQTTFHVEYSTDGTTWTASPVPDAVAGSAPGSIPVTHSLTGLHPRVEYQVRLVANRALGGWQTVSNVTSFTTLAAKPTVEETFAAAVGDTAAGLAAYLNPENDATTYQFEYGLTTDYGSLAPAVPTYVGDGVQRVTASVEAIGLQPETEYHFRVRATNGSGTTVGPDASFTTRAAADPPAGRAYEMVSPPDKHGADVLVPGHTEYNGNDFTPISSVSGDRVAFTSYGSFAGAVSHGVFTNYMATRGSEGWVTENLTPPLDGANASSPATVIEALSPDFSTRVELGPLNPQLNPEASEFTYNNFLWDPASRSYKWLSRGTPAKTFASIQFAAASDDFEHAYLNVHEAGAMHLTEDTPLGITGALYRWDADTEALTLVAKEPLTNASFPADSAIANPHVANSRGPAPFLWNPVSDDASRAYFYVTAGAGRQLYVRLDDEATAHVSASQRTPADPNGTKPATFRFASTDGNVAFFSSPEKLTDDATTGPTSAGEDLYRYDVESGELTDLTVDGVTANGAQVQGVIGGSDAGDRLYFVAKGVLAPGGVSGANNLYAWSDDGSEKGVIDFVSTGVASENWSGLPAFAYRHMGRVTPDGEHALFQSTSKFSSYENNGKYQVYVYSADSGSVQCASCPVTGVPAQHNALALGAGDDIQAARTLTEDGRLAFFSTADPLVAADVNGRQDGYVFDTASGRVSLLSPGTGPFDAMFLDADANGSDVFFGTRQQLVRIDTDDNMDVYDARVGGGIAAQNPPLNPPCAGEACRPEPLAPPPPSAAGSAALQAPGNAKPNRKKPKANKKKAKKKKASAKGKRAKGKRAKSQRSTGTKQGKANRDGRRS